MLMPQLVRLRPRLGSGDPTRIAGARRDLPVERNGELQMHERASGAHEMQIVLIEFLGFVGEQANGDFPARAAKVRKTFSRNFRIRIIDWADDARDSCLDERIAARRCAAVMSVGLEGHVGSGAGRSFSSLLERISLGVFQFLVDIKTFTESLAVRTCNNAPHQRTRTPLSD